MLLLRSLLPLVAFRGSPDCEVQSPISGAPTELDGWLACSRRSGKQLDLLLRAPRET